MLDCNNYTENSNKDLYVDINSIVTFYWQYIAALLTNELDDESKTQVKKLEIL